MHPTPTQPILIAGAGISGLAFAQGLLKATIPFRLFERDPTPVSRAQGYRVRINGTGIAALTSLLPPSLFSRLEASSAHVAPGQAGAGPTASLDALTAQPVPGPRATLPNTYSAKAPPGIDDVDPLNVDRTVLRSVLLRGLEEHVEFGKDFSSYETTPTGVTVRFSDSSEAQGSLLVGADGARSHVKRQFLPGHGLVDTEGRWIYGKTPLTAELAGRFSAEALAGLSIVRDRSREVPMSLLLEPVRFRDNAFRAELPDDYVYWVLQARKDRFEMDGDDTALLSLPAHEVAALAGNMTAHWHPSFRALFELQDAAKASLLRIASARPDIASWEPSGCVTLVGDAVHVMSPSAGVGAVTALRDAAVLAQVLTDEGVRAESTGRYETLMREYAGQAIKRSQVGGKFLFGMRPFEELEPVAG